MLAHGATDSANDDSDAVDGRKERSSAGSMYNYCMWLVTESYNHLTVCTGTDLENRLLSFHTQLGSKNSPESSLSYPEWDLLPVWATAPHLAFNHSQAWTIDQMSSADIGDTYKDGVH
jgi:hypothetical protein